VRTRIVNTRVGALARSLRDRWDLQRAAVGLGEEVGTLANDRVARLLLERLCLPGRTFVDVGAHIGSVIDGVRRHSRPGAIHAVEAIPEKAAALRRRFPGIIVHGCAIGEAAGEARFFVAAHSGYSSLDPALSARGVGVREIRVPVERLDALVHADGVDVVKIDVEGAELGVLRGADALVAASRPSILFESGPEAMEAFPKAALWNWLDARDYAIVVPNRVPHVDGGLGRDGFAEAHLFPRRTTNYWAIARERREQVRARARDVLRIA
jgi:FkbM family methyltransferase